MSLSRLYFKNVCVRVNDDACVRMYVCPLMNIDCWNICIYNGVLFCSIINLFVNIRGVDTIRAVLILSVRC